MVIVPTRELAKQVHDELTWLYAPQKLRIASVTGGSSYRDEHRSLSAGPAIVVGTPGRLLDHLNRGGIEAGDVGAVVLDEADRMLDLGFRDELEAILGKSAARSPHAPGVGDLRARRGGARPTACRRIRSASKARRSAAPTATSTTSSTW